MHTLSEYDQVLVESDNEVCIHDNLTIENRNCGFGLHSTNLLKIKFVNELPQVMVSPMQEIFANLTCITRTPVYSKHKPKDVWLSHVSLNIIKHLILIRVVLG
jgi:hypothetical protein